MKKVSTKGGAPKKKKAKWREWLITAFAIVSVTGTLIWIVYLASVQPKAGGGHHHAKLPSPGVILENDKVCMASNIFMEALQTTVEIEGKMYHSCSEHCTNELLSNMNTRFATDPWTNKLVDKADAFITMNPDTSGMILYFESQESLTNYIAKNK